MAQPQSWHSKTAWVIAALTHGCREKATRAAVALPLGGGAGRRALSARRRSRLAWHGGRGGRRPVAICFFISCKKCLPSVFWALGNVFAECPTKNTRQSEFADKFLPRALCRVLHSAKSLPSVLVYLPCAVGTRQSFRSP